MPSLIRHPCSLSDGELRPRRQPLSVPWRDRRRSSYGGMCAKISRLKKHGRPASYSCSEVAQAIGASTSVLCRWLGVRSARSRVTREDIRDILGWSPLDAELANCEVALARFVAVRSGDYVELDWLQPDGWPWVMRAVRPPRIFATMTRHDRDAEADARDLVQLYNRADRLGRLDDARRRAVAAVKLALRAMRSRERVVLVRRLEGKRGSPDTTWSSVATDSDLDSVPLTKEVFKVAVREFLTEYARISELLRNDPEYAK